MFEHDFPYTDDLPLRLKVAMRHFEFARIYSTSLFEDLSEDEWFWVPEGIATHIAWQVGHLAVSQYGLTLYRQRGRNLDVDNGLMSSKFRKFFMRGTTPVVDRDAHPTREEILAVLGRVHDQMRKEVVTFSDEELDEPIGPPHSGFATRYGALLFASSHEMIHSGQIGVIRRLMGKEPLR